MGGDLAAASPNALEHDERAIWLRAKRIDGGGMMRVRHKLAVVGVDNTGEAGVSRQLVN